MLDENLYSEVHVWTPDSLFFSNLKILTETSFFISAQTRRIKNTTKAHEISSSHFQPPEVWKNSSIYFNALIMIQTEFELYMFECDLPLFYVQIGLREPYGPLPHCLFL